MASACFELAMNCQAMSAINLSSPRAGANRCTCYYNGVSKLTIFKQSPQIYLIAGIPSNNNYQGYTWVYKICPDSSFIF